MTVVGHAAMVGAGEWITASGEWVNVRNHGLQFKARFMRTSAPSSVEGMEDIRKGPSVLVRADSVPHVFLHLSDVGTDLANAPGTVGGAPLTGEEPEEA